MPPHEQRDIRQLRDRLAGATSFVLGNGPSVKEHDLSRLRGLPVIGMNASPILDREYGFTSSYYVVSDTRFLTHPDKRAYASSAHLAPETIRVFREEMRSVDIKELIPTTYYVKVLGKNGFSDDLAQGFYFGSTTSMLAIQLAAYLGCRRIVLLGNDFRYSSAQPRFYQEKVVQEHDQFLSAQIWNIRNAYRALRARGVELCICTRNTNLVPYIPHRPFDEVVETRRS
jgi:hypothetical protein